MSESASTHVQEVRSDVPSSSPSLPSPFTSPLPPYIDSQLMQQPFPLIVVIHGAGPGASAPSHGSSSQVVHIHLHPPSSSTSNNNNNYGNNNNGGITNGNNGNSNGHNATVSPASPPTSIPTILSRSQSQSKTESQFQSQAASQPVSQSQTEDTTVNAATATGASPMRSPTASFLHDASARPNSSPSARSPVSPLASTTNNRGAVPSPPARSPPQPVSPVSPANARPAWRRVPTRPRPRSYADAEPASGLSSRLGPQAHPPGSSNMFATLFGHGHSGLYSDTHAAPEPEPEQREQAQLPVPGPVPVSTGGWVQIPGSRVGAVAGMNVTTQTIREASGFGVNTRPQAVPPHIRGGGRSRPSSWLGNALAVGGESSGDDGTGRYRPAWRSVPLASAPAPALSQEVREPLLDFGDAQHHSMHINNHIQHQDQNWPGQTPTQDVAEGDIDAIFPASPGPDRPSTCASPSPPPSQGQSQSQVYQTPQAEPDPAFEFAHRHGDIEDANVNLNIDLKNSNSNMGYAGDEVEDNEHTRRAHVETYNSAEWSQSTTMVPYAPPNPPHRSPPPRAARAQKQPNQSHTRLRAELQRLLADPDAIAGPPGPTTAVTVMPEDHESEVGVRAQALPPWMFPPQTQTETHAQQINQPESSWDDDLGLGDHYHEHDSSPYGANQSQPQTQTQSTNDIYDAMMVLLGARAGVSPSPEHSNPHSHSNSHSHPHAHTHTYPRTQTPEHITHTSDAQATDIGNSRSAGPTGVGVATGALAAGRTAAPHVQRPAYPPHPTHPIHWKAEHAVPPRHVADIPTHTLHRDQAPLPLHPLAYPDIPQIHAHSRTPSGLCTPIAAPGASLSAPATNMTTSQNASAAASGLRSPPTGQARRSHGSSPRGIIYRPPSVVVPPSPNSFINFDELDLGLQTGPNQVGGAGRTGEWTWVEPQRQPQPQPVQQRRTWHVSPYAQQLQYPPPPPNHLHAFTLDGPGTMGTIGTSAPTDLYQTF